MGYRKVILAKNEVYHIFTRGVAKQPIFLDSRDYQRMLDTIDYYRFNKLLLRFSHFKRLTKDQKDKVRALAIQNTVPLVEILAYCLMPNHLHLLLKQLTNNGISSYMSKFLNSYVRFFNVKHERVGPLFQSNFKAVRIEDNEQLLHVSRYIHLNPTSSCLIEIKNLFHYPWFSLPLYLKSKQPAFINPSLILDQFKDPSQYKNFVLDQADYQRNLHFISQIILEK